jgi:hypothetical protein
VAVKFAEGEFVPSAKFVIMGREGEIWQLPWETAAETAGELLEART